MQLRFLFITKRREVDTSPNATSTKLLSSGLLNSSKFVSDSIQQLGVESKTIQVIDNNCIDREVSLYKPTHVFIEAVWVVPNKFEILQKLHPKVKWIIRIHSELPFLANEGIGMEWALEYPKYDNVYLAPNAIRADREFKLLLDEIYGPGTSKNKCIYLPNLYDLTVPATIPVTKDPQVLRVGCFGAIRPMKNQLLQAAAMVEAAMKLNKGLEFHINVGRIENNGSPALKSLRAMFNKLPEKYKLIEHGWLDHDEFLQLAATMDLGLQVSLSETFNIVAADMVKMGVPVVTSPEIKWVCSLFHADPTSSADIEKKIKLALFAAKLKIHKLNEMSLKHTIENHKLHWVDFIAREKLA